MGKLDALTVNGPEDDVLDWDAVHWRQAEDDVRRLRQRIFTASQAGDLKKVRNLQKLMLRSRSSALLSVRRSTDGSCSGPGKRPKWLPGSSTARLRGGPGRLSGYSSPRQAENDAGSVFP